MTVPQVHAEGRSLSWSRGKVLGGSSSLNGMIYVRGHRSDDDEQVHHGCAGWDFDSVPALFRRSEDFDGGESDWHGAGFNHTTTRDGRRTSAWQYFLAPVLPHPRLTVPTDVTVHRIVVGSGRAVGVEITLPGTSEPTLVAAEREVVLCGGTIGSPKLLMLSGIGPAEHLRDHPLLSTVHASRRTMPAGKGNLLESQPYAKTDPRLVAPDLAPLFIHMPYPVPDEGCTIAPGLVRPLSRGTLRLDSSDPDAPRLVDPDVLAEPQDLEALVDAVELCREIGASRAFDGWRDVEVVPGPEARTRDGLREHVRRGVGTHHHEVGTCRTGVDTLSVVAPQLRVRGIMGPGRHRGGRSRHRRRPSAGSGLSRGLGADRLAALSPQAGGGRSRSTLVMRAVARRRPSSSVTTTW